MTTDTELMERAWEALCAARCCVTDGSAVAMRMDTTIAALRSRLDAPAQECDYPECSGDPRSCPENEGYGCCSARATAAVVDERAEFEAWWQEHGQFCRAGGGDYEKTFAYAAWQARAAKGG